MDSEQDFVSRAASLHGRLRAGVDLDLLVYTPEEIERMRDRPWLRHALHGGKLVYEKTRG